MKTHTSCWYLRSIEGCQSALATSENNTQLDITVYYTTRNKVLRGGVPVEEWQIMDKGYRGWPVLSCLMCHSSSKAASSFMSLK